MQYCTEQYYKAVKKWEKERAQARAEGCRFGQKKPVQGKLVEGPIPKPMLAVPICASSDEGSNDSNDTEGSDNEDD